MFHTNGRETFLVGIDWVDGWPVVVEDRFDAPRRDHSFVDRFEAPPLDDRWIAVGNFPDTFTSFDENGLILSAESDLDAGADRAAPVLATRVRDLQWTAEVDIDPGAGSTRFAVRIDAAHWYGIEVSPTMIEGKASVGPFVTTTGHVARPHGGNVRLRITARKPPKTGQLLPTAPDLVGLTLIQADSSEMSFGEFDGRYLSTEVAGGFTGRVLAIEPLAGETLLTRFSYRTDTDA
jgi:hypothetical protein